MSYSRAMAAFVAACCLLSTLAAAATIEIGLSPNPTTCQPMTVSWESTGGTGPWTVNVAPLGHVPISVSLPANYISGSDWSWTWDVPGYTSTVSEVIVAVSDSTGKVTGTSAFTKLTKAGSCTAPSEDLDFIWYASKSDPKQCNDWTFTVQEDRNNLGLKMPADILILPESSPPTRLRIQEGDKNKVDWKVNYPHGTKFAVAAFDAGKSGTGGVGSEVYTVSKGKSSSCLTTTQEEAVLGLRDATSTAVAAASATTATSSPTSVSASKMSTVRVWTTKSTSKMSNATHSPSAVTDSAANSGSKISSAAAIGGAVGGILGATLIGLAIFFLYRRRRNNGPDEYGVYPQNEKKSFFAGFGSRHDGSAGHGLPSGRFGASAGTQGGISPFTAGRVSVARWSARPYGAEAEEKRAVVSDRGPAGFGHGHSSSISLHRSEGSLSMSGPGFNSNPDLYGAQHEVSMITHSTKFQSDTPREVAGPRHQPSSARDAFQNTAAGQTQTDTSMPYRQPFFNPNASQHHVYAAQPSLPPSSANNATPAGHSRDLLATMRSDPFADPRNRHYPQRSRDDSVRQAPIYANHMNPNSAPPPADRTNMGPPTRYADPKESAARFRTLDTQLLNDRNKVVSNTFSDLSEDDDEGGLPYM